MKSRINAPKFINELATLLPGRLKERQFTLETERQKRNFKRIKPNEGKKRTFFKMYNHVTTKHRSHQQSPDAITDCLALQTKVAIGKMKIEKRKAGCTRLPRNTTNKFGRLSGKRNVRRRRVAPELTEEYWNRKGNPNAPRKKRKRLRAKARPINNKRPKSPSLNKIEPAENSLTEHLIAEHPPSIEDVIVRETSPVNVETVETFLGDAAERFFDPGLRYPTGFPALTKNIAGMVLTQVDFGTLQKKCIGRR